MPLGVPAKSSALVILVGVTATPTAPIGGLLSPNYVGDRPTSNRDYHGQASFVVNGKIVKSASVNCDYETGDTGQKILHDAWVSGNTIYYKYMPDGTNGETLPVQVSHEELSSPDANGVQQITWTLNQVADAVVVAGGFNT